MEIIKLFLEPVTTIGPKLPAALLNFVVGYLLIKLIMFIVRRAVKILNIHQDLRGIIITFSKLFLWLVLIVFILSQLGFGDLAILLSGSAVVLVFFLNTTAGPLLADVFAGVFLISDPDFTVGMEVEVNDGKTKGTIQGIDMRKVRILDEKGKLHVLPNSMIEKGEWTVVARCSTKRKG